MNRISCLIMCRFVWHLRALKPTPKSCHARTATQMGTAYTPQHETASTFVLDPMTDNDIHAHTAFDPNIANACTSNDVSFESKAFDACFIHVINL